MLNISCDGEGRLIASDKIIGKRIRKIRINFDCTMTRLDVSKATGITLSMMGRIENGTREVGICQLHSIVEYFNSVCVSEGRDTYTVPGLYKERGFRVHERHQPDSRPAREGDE